MFHSVQLNVNNPHFLIMQGRINKVSRSSTCQPSCTPTGKKYCHAGLAFIASLILMGCLVPLTPQVCNMKPAEIMSLLEEASGTRMYEKKKEKAMQTMEKKDQKLKEIEAVLNEEIQPAVEKLKKQCSDYNEWAELSSCRERLKRFLVAYDYTECRK